MSSIKVAEVLAALSLTTDLASGLAAEKGLRTCLVATALAEVAGLPATEQRAVFHASLLRAVGCTNYAPENAAMFVDDVAFQAALKDLDPGDAAVWSAQLAEFGGWAGASLQPVLAKRLVDNFHTVGVQAALGGCEVSRALGPGLGLTAVAVDALDDVYERWDGLGIPRGRVGEEISLVARVVHVAEQAVLAHGRGGAAAAVQDVRRRAGGHLDPDLAAVFVSSAEAALARLDVPDVVAAVVAAEPQPRAVLPVGHLHRLCLALAIVVDLKSTHLVGHSTHVADLAAASAGLLGLEPQACDELRAAALVHDLGRVGVSSAVWDHPGPLGAADQERVRLHTYWTDRILRRCPPLAPLALVASSHHERQDGSGYHRGIRSSELPPSARLLAAADVFAALTESRAYRPAFPAAEAARLVTGEATAGRLDPDACAAVVEAAGLPRPRRTWPCDLSDREVEVLRLAARGLTNQHIAAQLAISERTVGHHLAHIYDKIGRRTRAGAAVFAMEHGLLPPAS